VKRIIVFRFHKNAAVCRNRLELLRLFNPAIELYGLYGGDERAATAMSRRLSSHLEHCYCIRGRSAAWKWKNGDLALAAWFRDFGSRIPFDVVHVLEWDMLVLDSLDRVYGHLPARSIGLTGLLPMARVNPTWKWISQEPYKSEWESLRRHVQKNHHYRGEPYVCKAGGVTLPRGFLEDSCNLEIPELCNDEIRIPLYGQILGYELCDNGYFDLFDKTDRKLFSLWGEQVGTGDILGELLRKNGRRVFHPYEKVLSRLATAGRLQNGYRTLHQAGRRVLAAARDVARRVTRRSAPPVRSS